MQGMLIIHAAARGDTVTVRTLIEARCNMDLQDKNGTTAVYPLRRSPDLLPFHSFLLPRLRAPALELLACKDEALLVRGNALLVLYDDRYQQVWAWKPSHGLHRCTQMSSKLLE